MRSRHDVDWGDADPAERLLLADAQTSGGLLDRDPSTPTRSASRSTRAGVAHAAIGEVVAGDPGHIAVDGRLAADQPE